MILPLKLFLAFYLYHQTSFLLKLRNLPYCSFINIHQTFQHGNSSWLNHNENKTQLRNRFCLQFTFWICNFPSTYITVKYILKPSKSSQRRRNQWLLKHAGVCRLEWGGMECNAQKRGPCGPSRRHTLYFSKKLGQYKLIAILASDKHFPQMLRYFTCRPFVTK